MRHNTKTRFQYNDAVSADQNTLRDYETELQDLKIKGSNFLRLREINRALQHIILRNYDLIHDKKDNPIHELGQGDRDPRTYLGQLHKAYTRPFEERMKTRHDLDSNQYIREFASLKRGLSARVILIRKLLEKTATLSDFKAVEQSNKEQVDKKPIRKIERTPSNSSEESEPHFVREALHASTSTEEDLNPKMDKATSTTRFTEPEIERVPVERILIDGGTIQKLREEISDLRRFIAGIGDIKNLITTQIQESRSTYSRFESFNRSTEQKLVSYQEKLSNQDNQLKHHSSLLRDHEVRIRVLEREREKDRLKFEELANQIKHLQAAQTSYIQKESHFTNIQKETNNNNHTAEYFYQAPNPYGNGKALDPSSEKQKRKEIVDPFINIPIQNIKYQKPNTNHKIPSNEAAENLRNMLFDVEVHTDLNPNKNPTKTKTDFKEEYIISPRKEQHFAHDYDYNGNFPAIKRYDPPSKHDSKEGRGSQFGRFDSAFTFQRRGSSTFNSRASATHNLNSQINTHHVAPSSRIQQGSIVENNPIYGKQFRKAAYPQSLKDDETIFLRRGLFSHDDDSKNTHGLPPSSRDKNHDFRNDAKNLHVHHHSTKSVASQHESFVKVAVPCQHKYKLVEVRKLSSNLDDIYKNLWEAAREVIHKNGLELNKQIEKLERSKTDFNDVAITKRQQSLIEDYRMISADLMNNVSKYCDNQTKLTSSYKETEIKSTEKGERQISNNVTTYHRT